MSNTSNDVEASRRRQITVAWIQPSLEYFRQDAPIYLVVGIYALAAWMLSLYLGDDQKYRPFQYVPSWTTLSILVLAIMGAARAFWTNPARPLSSLVSSIKKHWKENFVKRLPVILAAGIFWGVFTSVKNMLPNLHSFTWDPALAAIDYRMLGNHDAWRLAAVVIPDGLPLDIMDEIYSKGWFILVMGLSAYVAASPAMRRHRRQYFLTFFASWIFAGNILACIFMSGGPCFYAQLTGDHLRFAPLLQSISTTTAAALQDYLWNAYANGWNSFGSGISAFPSVHLVSTTLVALLLGKKSKRLFWTGVFFTGLIGLGSIRLGWHYFSDGVVGIVIAVITWHLVQLMERSIEQRDARLA